MYVPSLLNLFLKAISFLQKLLPKKHFVKTRQPVFAGYVTAASYTARFLTFNSKRTIQTPVRI